ncbi:MAG: DUF2851 family protein [Chloroflexi bacterium]|nr:DUF2851 family protein [Chloroflexota bacterium]
MEAAYLRAVTLQGVNEILVARIWERQLVLRDALATDTGMALQVVYPGRRSHEGGPDFRHAIIAAADASLWRGDVEIHVRASDWRNHGHHRDPRYNGTVLHAVLHGDLPGGAFLESGSLLPTLAMEDCLSAPLESLCRETPPAAAEPWPCRRAAVGSRGLEKLDAAGEARFLARAAGFEADLSCQAPVQVLYEGIMAALGYAHNKDPFRELARRLPLSVLEGMAAERERERQPEALQARMSPRTLLAEVKARERQLKVFYALLLGAAGLLPSQRRPPLPASFADAGFVFGLEEAWQDMKLADEGLPWRWGGVRPENLPPRRLAGMAHLLARHRSEGLLEAVLRCVFSGPPLEALCALERALVTPAEGFWVNHYDFGLPAPRDVGALIGRERAREIVVNVALPFLYAYAEATGNPGLADRALEIFRLCPPLGENEITREMGHLLFGGRKIRPSARRQQGMIHIYRKWCLERCCEECPLGG